MPQVKFSTSALGLSIVSDIERFLKTNADALANDTEVSSDDGTRALAHAIAFGVAKALASPSFVAALTAGVGPTTPGPLINTALAPQVIEAP